jgi:hypothetical protein
MFEALLVGLAGVLYYVLPPQPRWQVQLETGEQVVAVEPVHGRVFTHNNEGVAAIDLFTGRRLGLVFAATGFTYSNLDGFSPDHRYYAVRFDNGRQLAVVDVVTLQAQQIDLQAPGGSDRFTHYVFSPGSEWVAATAQERRYTNSVVAEVATGKVLYRTEPGTYFSGFVPQSNRVVCSTFVGNERQQYVVSVWDLSTGKKLHESPPFFVGFTDSRGLYEEYPRGDSADHRTMIGWLESAEGKPELVAWDVLNNRLQARVPAEVSAHVSHAAVSPDGKLLMLAAGPNGKRLAFVDLTTGTVRKEHQLPARAERLQFCADPTLAACRTRTGEFEFRVSDGELERHTPAGDELWKATPDPAIAYDITVDGERAHLLLEVEFTFHFRDSRTGRVVASSPQRADYCSPPEHQFGRRVLFVRSRVTEGASPVEEFLRQWLPLGDPPDTQIRCIDLATGREGRRVVFPDAPRFQFAEEHGLLATWHSNRNSCEVLACWEVPLRPSWAWVLGPPLGLMALALAREGWRYLRRRRSVPAVPA